MIKDRVVEVLNTLEVDELVAMHNACCDAIWGADDYIYRMEDFDEIMSGRSPWDIACRCFYGHEFNPNHDYFRFNGYANLESFDYAPSGNSGIYVDDIADYIVLHEDAMCNREIESILEEYAENPARASDV